MPTRDHTIAGQSKNYRYSTNHQVVIDADTRLVVVVGRPLPGNRNECRAWSESGAKAAVGKTTTIADGGCPGTGLVIPHRRRAGEELSDCQQAHNKSHKHGRRPRRARLRPHEDLQDPARLQAPRRGRTPRHAWHRLHNLNLAG